MSGRKGRRARAERACFPFFFCLVDSAPKPPELLTGKTMQKFFTMKQLMTVLGSFSLLLILLAVLHSSFIAPAVLFRVSEILDKKLEDHRKHPHPKAVDKNEIEHLYERILLLEEAHKKSGG